MTSTSPDSQNALATTRTKPGATSAGPSNSILRSGKPASKQGIANSELGIAERWWVALPTAHCLTLTCLLPSANCQLPLLYYLDPLECEEELCPPPPPPDDA